MSNQTAIDYWCYVCQAKISSFQPLNECSTCHQSAIQLLESDNSGNPPQNFQVYQIQNNQAPQTVPVASTVSMAVLSSSDQPAAGVNIQSFFNSNVNGVQISIVSGDFSLGDMSMGIPFMNQIPSFADFGGSMLSNLLNSLMRNESNLTPASPQQIEQLSRVQRVRQCSICQQIDENEEGQAHEGYKLPCNHQFHRDCISPWLQKTNTCPCCRVALP